LSESPEGSPAGSLSHREAYVESKISDLRASGISACMRLFSSYHRFQKKLLESLIKDGICKDYVNSFTVRRNSTRKGAQYLLRERF
jgi:hypothetical protein